MQFVTFDQFVSIFLVICLLYFAFSQVTYSSYSVLAGFAMFLASALILSFATLTWLFGAFLVAFPNHFLTTPWPPVEFDAIAREFFKQGDNHRTYIPLLITFDVVVDFFIGRMPTARPLAGGSAQANNVIGYEHHSSPFLLGIAACVVTYILVAVVAAANMDLLHKDYARSALMIAFAALFILRAMTLYRPRPNSKQDFNEFSPRARSVQDL